MDLSQSFFGAKSSGITNVSSLANAIAIQTVELRMALGIIALFGQIYNALSLRKLSGDLSEPNFWESREAIHSCYCSDGRLIRRSNYRSAVRNFSKPHTISNLQRIKFSNIDILNDVWVELWICRNSYNCPVL